MADSAIQWTDKVWNPTVGCTRVSPGCEHCYAEALAPRLVAMGQPVYERLTKRHNDGSVNWTGEVRCLPERLSIPLGWKKPQRVFVNSMSDLFHEAVPDGFIANVFSIMAVCTNLTFQVLTKRPSRMLDLVGSQAFEEMIDTWMRLRAEKYGWCLDALEGWPLPNVWLGVSTEDQATADERIPLLLKTPAAVRFISAEPLLESLGIAEYLTPGWYESALDWVITGGESGPNHRPFDPQWAMDIRDQCAAAGVSYFHKQNGGRTPHAGGRELDGREWNEMPRVEVTACP